MNTSATERQYISVTETAKALRLALKDAFPSITFSVKSKSYSGGASITIHWTDGPTTPMVEQVSRAFQGASFNPMDDLKSYHDSIYQGQRVQWGADYVHTSRDISATLLQRAADRVAKRFGITDMPPIITGKYGEALLDQAHPKLHQRLEEWARYDINDLVHQESYQLSVAPDGAIYRVVRETHARDAD